MSRLLRCESCGGTVRYVVERSAGACLFCGAKTLTLYEPDTPPAEPSGIVPPRIQPAEAAQRFRAWAAGSFWYPKALREAHVELSPLLLPAYRLAADVTAYYAGLVRASTRSGKRPVAGEEHWHDEVYVPASGALSEPELAALEPFDASEAVPVERADALARWPQETPQRSPRFARARAHARMTARAEAFVAHERGLLSCRVSPVFENERFDLFAVPIYAGIFVHRGRPRRLLVNAQTGEVVGKAPLDRVKVTLAVLLAAAALLATCRLLGCT